LSSVFWFGEIVVMNLILSADIRTGKAASVERVSIFRIESGGFVEIPERSLYVSFS